MTLIDLQILSVNEENKFSPMSLVSGSDVLQWLVNVSHKYPIVFEYSDFMAALNNNETVGVAVKTNVMIEQSLSINKDVSFWAALELVVPICSIRL
jgi:hypothetical protein